ncbi:MAG: hypothetical protein JJT87_06815 [Halomonas sp.]|nr:hypothetical protein [Halomonas sp.]MCC5901621.1 hypothetical protein [Halomonas sp.]
MEFNDSKVQAALIAAGVSVFILVLKGITRPLWERYFHSYKLESDYKFEQKKQVREAISKHKIVLLNAAESLNHRMWNFSENALEGWHRADNFPLYEKYYLVSFCYRFLLFFAICREIEKETIFLDSTVSTNTDLTLLKYIKLFPQLFCDVSIFDGVEYDKSSDTDHFYRDDFNAMLKKISPSGELLDFEEFKALNLQKDFSKIISYLSGISVQRDCIRWQSLSSFHFVLMAFLNEYGYDFQVTSEKQFKDLSNNLPSNTITQNVEKFVKRSGLGKNKQLKSAIMCLKRV